MSLVSIVNGTLVGSGVPITATGSMSSGSGTQWAHCQDLHGRIISHGVHFVPGPDACLHCVCEFGQAQLCRAMLCGQPPEHRNCKPIRVGTSCCDFVCPDGDSPNNGSGDGYGRGPGTGSLDMGVVVPKIIITALLSLLSLSLLFFLVNRLRQRDLRGRFAGPEMERSRRMYHGCDDPRSLDYLNCDFSRNSSFRNGHLYPPQYTTWWKPPYFSPPRGEAPPPYEEAIASTSNIIPLLPISSSQIPVGTLTTIPPPAVTTGSVEQVTEAGPRERGIEGSSIVLHRPPQHLKEAGSELQVPQPSSSTAPLEPNTRIESRQKHSNNGAHPPAYSSLVPVGEMNRPGFRRSLTLPRRPNFLLTDPGDLDGTATGQQRYSLQLGVTDWNMSSSSSLSLTPTPTTPILGREDSSSSPTSSVSSV